MNRTIIYARVSTEDQLEKYGLPCQIQACKDYAIAHQLSILEVVTDEGISGSTLVRPGLKRMRGMVAAGQVDVVLMLDVDRLSRVLIDLLNLKKEIEERARLEFVTAKFEDSVSGQMFFGIRGVIAAYERGLTRERTMRGRVERAKGGLIVGGRTAYGYRYDAGKLIPDDRADTVRDIFGWYDTGLTIREIAVKLRAFHTPTWGGGQWGHSSVRRILINESYAGLAYYGTHRRVGTTLRVREPVDRVTLEVPPIVDRDQWERVQARLADNPLRGAPSLNYLLRGLLYCQCGRRMTGDCRRGHVSYRCNGRDSLRFRGGPCKQSVNARKLDAAVWAAVSRAITDEGFLLGILREHQQDLRETSPERLDQLASQVKKLQRKEQACLSALLDPDLAEDRAAIKLEYRTAQQERRRLEGEISAADRQNSAAVTAGEWLAETVALLRADLPRLTGMEERQAFLRGLLSRADWDGGQEVKLSCVLRHELPTASIHCDDFLRLTLTAEVAA